MDSSLDTMNIRPATVADAEKLSALLIELSGPFYTSPTRVGAEPFLASVSVEALRRYLSAPNFSYYVAEASGELAGFIALRDNSHLFNLFVATPFQRNGLATQLWGMVKAEALAAGNPGQFTVNASLNAVPVYQRFGFVCKGEIQFAHGISFQSMHCHEMAHDN
jgi:ribosomal protein S18 acetylase RimI-like enzyme